MKYSDLYLDDSVKGIDDEFNIFLQNASENLYNIFSLSRKSSLELNSQNLIEISIFLEKFLSKKFAVVNQLNDIKENFHKLTKFNDIKRSIIQRIALKKFTSDHKFSDSVKTLFSEDENIDEIFIKKIETLPESSFEYNKLLEYAAYRIYSKKYSNLFCNPEKLDYENLIGFEKKNDEIFKSCSKNHHSHEQAFFEAKYCIKCHYNSKDSCKKGHIDKEGNFSINPLGNILAGCPLNIKISEANILYENGNIISSLAVITLDNPLVCLTGKRICNDCEKACIFQKQKPVDVPSIESKILEDVLNLNYGFEIYSLLIRWNPLDTKKFNIKNKNGNILVVGSGPSGIASSFYFLRNGFNVTLVEGVKIKPLPDLLKQSLIKDYSQIKEIYKNIKPQGFGGVAEFGITDRWNKENLIIARLILEKFTRFDISGSIRFGSNIDYLDAKKLGYDHISLCCGSGYPSVPNLENINKGNIRSASDFLMSLGSGGMHFENSKTNFFFKLPLVVLGGGLTAIDAATEAIKFYPEYVKRIYKNLNKIKQRDLSQKDKKDLEILLLHAEKFINEDKSAKQENREINYTKIIDRIGGVKIIYRKNLISSPSYRLNHDEVEDCLNHGVKIIQNADINKINIDEFGNISSLEIIQNKLIKTLDVQTMLFATGTRSFELSDLHLNPQADISFFGDMDKEYSGSVVKALASVKNKMDSIISEIDNSTNKKISLKDKTKSIIKNIIFKQDFYEIEIENTMISNKIKCGNFVKISYKSEPIALHAIKSSKSCFKVYVKPSGKSSKELVDLNIGDEISVMGPLGNSYDCDEGDKILFIANSYRVYPFLDFIKRKKLDNYEFEDDLDRPKFAEVNFNKFDRIFINLSNADIIKISSLVEKYKDKILFSSNVLMQCMMGGLCGQCFTKIDDKATFLCKHHIQKFDNNLLLNTNIKLKQNSLLEKICEN